MSNTTAETVRLVNDVSIQCNQTVSLDSLFGGLFGTKVVAETLQAMPHLLQKNDAHQPWMAWVRDPDNKKNENLYRLKLSMSQVDGDLKNILAWNAWIDLELLPDAINLTPHVNLTADGEVTARAHAGMVRATTLAMNHIIGVTVIRANTSQVKTQQQKLGREVRHEPMHTVQQTQTAIREEARQAIRRHQLEVKVEHVRIY